VPHCDRVPHCEPLVTVAFGFKRDNTALALHTQEAENPALCSNLPPVICLPSHRSFFRVAPLLD
ncbi:hypothetical protein AOLI_G00178620, partial [Acnodon oligacanthus]